MLNYKVILIKRENGYLAYRYDSEEVLKVKNFNKRRILRLAQSAILREEKKKGDIFNRRFKDKPEEILRERGYVRKPGDEMEVEEVGIEFGYNGYYRLAPIEE